MVLKEKMNREYQETARISPLQIKRIQTQSQQDQEIQQLKQQLITQTHLLQQLHSLQKLWLFIQLEKHKGNQDYAGLEGQLKTNYNELMGNKNVFVSAMSFYNRNNTSRSKYRVSKMTNSRQSNGSNRSSKQSVKNKDIDQVLS